MRCKGSVLLLGMLVVALLLPVIPVGAQVQEGTSKLTTRPLRFNPGPPGAATVAHAIALPPGALYDPARGYGWTEAPQEAFVRDDLSRSRTNLLIDGVAGPQLAFRADVPAGSWWITLWVEAGIEDSSTLAIDLQGARQPLEWQAFRPQSEPRSRIQDIFRVFHRRVQVQNGGLRLRLTGGRDEVRLLGLSLVPDVGPTTPTQRALLARIEAAGHYNALTYDPTAGKSVFDFQTETTDVLERIAEDLQSLVQEDPSDAFAAHWLEQLRMLIHAERYFARRGWEWAGDVDGHNLFERLYQAVILLDGLLDRPDAMESPLYERALYTRGRILYWLSLERRGLNEEAGAKRDLAILYARHPGDPMLAMYNGQQVDFPDPCDHLRPASNAPAWSVTQLEAMCRVRWIAHWWIEEQQAPNGELGGKLGDDVELLRWWPALILSGDTTTLKGWKRLANGVWASNEVYEGYTRNAEDVEHGSEFISDTAPQMVVYSDSQKYVDRLRPSARYFENLWTGITPGGRRYFRSAWFSSSEVETDPPKNRDAGYNTRAVKTIRYLAWKTSDPHVIDLLHQWSEAWVHAAMRTDKGKPAGIIPASVRFPDEAINGDEPTWYKPNMFWPYFDWDRLLGSMMMDQLLFTYTLTADSSLLQPMFAALDLVERYAAGEWADTNTTHLTPGSTAWAAAQLTHSARSDDFWSVVSQWRLYSSDTRYDRLLLQYGTPYLRYRLTGDEKYVTDGTRRILGSLRYNSPIRTYEAIHTDRVDIIDDSKKAEAAAAHLKAMLTGDNMPESMSPYYAVSWEHTDDGFTALVGDAGPDRLSIRLFSHSPAIQDITMRLWQLEPGTYRMTREVDGTPGSRTVEVRERGQRVSLTLPPQALLIVRFERIQ